MSRATEDALDAARSRIHAFEHTLPEYPSAEDDARWNEERKLYAAAERAHDEAIAEDMAHEAASPVESADGVDAGAVPVFDPMTTPVAVAYAAKVQARLDAGEITEFQAAALMTMLEVTVRALLEDEMRLAGLASGGDA